ncbi:hypothetical protein [Kineosporia sp. NBRC 101731]|uniref:hypothetical protein n=1 Tax=Kineosporia sp. NBRC 101731 TaxID=3032199 RepID=UPI0024A0EC47|nr:hypothetical protein [Kineosporia sp. NBRC 101731]GLY33488.1 hypothetical protein Kisp02_68530 [Kineosporia sp. NBRC 101731]
MPSPSIVWIDQQYDRENDDRYATHVTALQSVFSDSFGDISPVTFACTAWRLATVPYLDPGYVRFHRRVLGVICERNAWDGSLIARVQLVSPLPGPLARTQVWGHDRGWKSWPAVLGHYLPPSPQELARFPFVRPVLLVDAPLPLTDLPPAPERPGPELAELAQRAVSVLTRELNDLLSPIINTLESG